MIVLCIYDIIALFGVGVRFLVRGNEGVVFSIVIVFFGHVFLGGFVLLFAQVDSVVCLLLLKAFVTLGLV